MKRLVLPILCMLLLLLSGCTQSPAPADAQTANRNDSSGTTPFPTKIDSGKTSTASSVVEIKEKMFIQQCDDIYLNTEDYKDKSIKLEGIYASIVSSDTGEIHHIIYRKTPGCCGTDGQIGFEFTYNGDIPKLDDWISVVGTVETVKGSDGIESIVLQLSELKVKEQRGEEFVMN